MGAHNVRRNRRHAALAGRGALTAATAFALLGGGAGVAFAGDAPSDSDSKSDSSHDKGDWDHGKGHDKGDHHDGWGKKHDRCDDHKKWDGDEKDHYGFLGGLLGGDDHESYDRNDDCDYSHDKKWDGKDDYKKYGEKKMDDGKSKLPETPKSPVN